MPEIPDELAASELGSLRRQLALMQEKVAACEQTRKQLAEEERFLSEIFASVQDGISILGRDLDILRVNTTMEQWYKHAVPLVGKKCYAAYHGRNQPCQVCPTVRAMKNNRAAFDIVPKRGASGEIIGWLELYSFPLVDMTSGMTKGVIEYVRDITERKHAEDELKKSESKNRVLLKSIQLPVVALKNDMTVFYCNEAYAGFVGKPISELEGRNLIALFPAFGTTRSYEAYLRVLETGKAEEVEGSVGNAVMHTWIYRTVDGILAIAEDVTERRRAEIDLKESYEKLHRTMEQTIQALSVTLGKRDPYTSTHQQRVTQLACAIALEMELTDNQVSGMRVAAILHDIGKIYVPSEILTKPTKLSAAEFGIIKTHPKAGYDILASIEFPWPVATIVLQHHEKLDGSGYPSSLKGDQILLEARILCVADIIEAMSSDRPYRPALGLNMALDEIVQNRGIKFDPLVVDACVRLIQDKGYKLD
jgi:putative nucleotidyltransferase with HDIG domain